MLEFTLTVLLAAHLLCMNVASAGPLVCIWLDARAGRGDPAAYWSGRWLAWLSVALLAAGSLLGVAIGTILWSDSYRNLLTRLSSKVHFGAWEMIFSLGLMIGYAWWWKAANRADTGPRWTRGFLSVLAASNLLYHFPTLMFVMGMLARSGQSSGDRITAAMFRSLMAQPEILANSFHFLLAAVAVTGVTLIAFAWRRAAEHESEFSRVAVWGGRIALVPTLLQIPVGIWVLTTLDPVSQETLMGSNLVATSLFGVALLAALRLMHHLASVSLGDVEPFRLRAATVYLVVTVLLMTAAWRQTQPF